MAVVESAAAETENARRFGKLGLVWGLVLPSLKSISQMQLARDRVKFFDTRYARIPDESTRGLDRRATSTYSQTVLRKGDHAPQRQAIRSTRSPLPCSDRRRARAPVGAKRGQRHRSSHDERPEENGFQIREVRNTEISVPISTEARAATDAGGQPMAAGLNCGTATLIISRSIGGKIRIATAYAVQATSVYHRWNVAGSSDVGAWNEPFSGINASNAWNATHDHQFPYGTSHGFGQIKSDSYVRLWNGARCSFVGTLPSDTW